jgi:hypothetical protein
METGDAMTSRKINQSRKLSFQQLEDRQLMAANVAASMGGHLASSVAPANLAGNVTAAVVNHGLTLTGDNGSNQIEITQVGTNLFEVSGLNGTTVNGKANQTFSITGNISANFKAGDDGLSLDGTKSSGGYMTLPGSLNVVLGDGNNGLVLQNTTVSGNLSVTGGSGADDAYFYDSGVGLGSNNDCSITLGAGANTIVTDYLRVQRDLLINDISSSGDFMLLQGVSAGRNVNIQTGNGSDDITIDNFFAKNDLNISTGGGNDYVVLGEVIDGYHGTTPTSDSQGQLYAAHLSVDLGTGDDQLSLGQVFVPYATIDGNTGNDTLYRDAVTGFDSLRQVNFQHQYNFGVGVIPANNPGGHRPTV